MKKEPKSIRISARIKPSLYQQIIKKKKKDSINTAIEKALEAYII